jgi:uncharacterized membrane protein YkoI
MKKLFAIFAAVALVGGGFVLADDKIKLEELPKAVVEAIKAKFPKAELKEAEMEEEEGKKIFEVKLVNGKEEIEVTLSIDGKIIELERKLDPENLPKEIKEAIEAKFPKSKVTSAVEETENDKTVIEVEVTSAEGKKFEVKLDGKAKIVEVEDVADEKKDDKKDK